jgi:RNA polymerase sigma-70 factor, ECF subfamily
VRGVPRSGLDHEEEFRRLFSEYNRQVLAYALRRCGQRADAEDVVAGTFAVAWRRFADAPQKELRLAWLYAIAARVLANQRRSLRRLGALRSKLRAQPPVEAPERVELDEVVAALRELRPEEQEILRLAAWEGLTNAELAVTLGCSENAAAIRLHRARKRLTEQFEKGTEPAGHSVVGGTE